MNAENSNLKTIVRIVTLTLVTTFIAGTSNAVAAVPSIFTSSEILSGAISPTLSVGGVDLASDNDKFDFTVDVGKTELRYDSVAVVDSTHLRFNFVGTAAAGTITIQANSSAFSPVANEASNTLNITILEPLISQRIDFVSPTSMSVQDKDQTPLATSTSDLEVTLFSNTPSVCTVDFLKIHAVAAGTCSIKASQAGDTTLAPAVGVVKTFTVLAAPSLVEKVSTNEILVPTDLGVANYNPKDINESYVSVLVLGSDNGTDNATLVKLAIEKESTDVNAVFLISAVSTSQESKDGYFVAKVVAITGNGVGIVDLNIEIEIYLPAGALGSELSWSRDGLTWTKLQKIDSEILPTNFHVAYFVETDGSYEILTNQLGFFGYRKGQSSLSSGSTVAVLMPTAKAILSSNTNSGTQSVGLVKSSVAKYSCDLLSYSLSKSSTSVQATFCPQDAGKTATLYVKSISTAHVAIKKKIASALIDSNGIAVFYVTSAISNSNFLEVFVDGDRRI